MHVIPFAADHLDDVTRLVAAHVSPELERDHTRFRAYLDAHYRTGPNRSEDIPSLVAIAEDGRLAGFCGITTSPMTWRGRPIRLAASGPLVADPAHRASAPGLFLTRAMLGGPQELSIADGANHDSTVLWQRMGAEVVSLPSMRWVRPLRPSGLGLSLAAERVPALRFLVGRTSLLDRIARPLRPEPVRTTDHPVDAESLAALVARVGPGFTLAPAYEPATLRWQLAELARVEVKGSLVSRAVTDPDGRDIGWFVYHLLPDGLCRVLQIGCRPRHGHDVIAHLCDHAARHDAGALFGRLEAHYWEALRDQPIIVARRAPRVLIHADDAELRGDVHAGRALITRLEGEAWNGLHHQPLPA